MSDVISHADATRQPDPGGDRGVVRRNDVDACVGAGSLVKHDLAAAHLHQLITRAQCTPFAAHGIVREQREAFQLVVEAHIQPILRRDALRARYAKFIDQRIAH